MKKKVLSLVLAVIFAFTFVATTVLTASAEGAVLTVSEVSETSSTITVAIGISGNPGIAAIGINLTFDSTLLAEGSVQSAGIANAAGMVAWGSFNGNNVRIVVEENNAGDVIKSSGTICTVTFKKLGTVDEGASAAFTAAVIDSLTYGEDGESVSIADATASATLDKVETTTKKPATTKAPATTKKPTATKPATTKAPVTTKPNVTSPTLPGVTVPTTVEETTEEETTEEVTEEVTTEYESYSYTAPEVDDEAEDEEDSGKTGRIIAIVVIVVCAGAAAALYFTKKK